MNYHDRLTLVNPKLVGHIMLDLLPVEVVVTYIIPKLSLQDSFSMVATCRDLRNLRYDPSIISKYSLLDLMEYGDMTKLRKRLLQLKEKYVTDQYGNLLIPRRDYSHMFTTFHLNHTLINNLKVYIHIKYDKWGVKSTYVSRWAQSILNPCTYIYYKEGKMVYSYISIDGSLYPNLALGFHDILHIMFYRYEIPFTEIMLSIRVLQLDMNAVVGDIFTISCRNHMTCGHKYMPYYTCSSSSHNKLNNEQRMLIAPYFNLNDRIRLLSLERSSDVTLQEYELQVVALCTFKIIERSETKEDKIIEQYFYKLIKSIVRNCCNISECINSIKDITEIKLNDAYKFMIIREFSKPKYEQALVYLINALPLTSADSVLTTIEDNTYKTLNDKSSIIFRRALKTALNTAAT